MSSFSEADVAPERKRKREADLVAREADVEVDVVLAREADVPERKRKREADALHAREADVEADATGISEEALKQVGTQMLRVYNEEADANRRLCMLEKEVKKVQQLEEEVKKVQQLEKEVKKVQQLEKEVKKVHQLEKEMKRRLHVSELFEGGKLAFTCDLLDNLVVKLTYALQKVVAREINSHNFEERSFWKVFEEKNLAYLCYHRALKRWLKKKKKLTPEVFIDQLLVDRNVGISPDQGSSIQRFLEMAEAEVANELQVPVMDLRLTAATYLFYLKPVRNVHRNQLHPPAYWRFRAMEDPNPAPARMITACLQAMPKRTMEDGDLLKQMVNLEMIDIVASTFRSILSSHLSKMSEDLVMLIIRKVRQQACSNLASSLLESLTGVSKCLPDSLTERFETLPYNKKIAAGWVVRPRGASYPGCEMVLTRQGQWNDMEGNQLPLPFHDWPLGAILAD